VDKVHQKGTKESRILVKKIIGKDFTPVPKATRQEGTFFDIME